LSLRELAESVGMRAPSLYTYFASKNDLYDAMYAVGMQQFAAEMEKTPRGRDARAGLRNLAKTFVRVALEDPVRYELLFHRPIPGFVPSPAALTIGLSTLANTRAVAEAAGLRSDRAFDLFMATSRGLIAMQIANEPGGDRWARLIQEAVDILVAHYSAGRPTGRGPPAPSRVGLNVGRAPPGARPRRRGKPWPSPRCALRCRPGGRPPADRRREQHGGWPWRSGGYRPPSRVGVGPSCCSTRSRFSRRKMPWV
jgi:AcrR family transcriptional regulator